MIFIRNSNTMGKKVIRYTNSGHRYEIEGVIEAGETIKVTVIPAEGYEFNGWANDPGDGSITFDSYTTEGYPVYDIEIPECGIMYQGIFVEEGGGAEYTLTLDYGSFTDTITVKGKTTVLLPGYSGQPVVGNTFGGWSENQGGQTADYFVNDYYTIESDTVLYGVWVLNSHILTFANGDNDTLECKVNNVIVSSGANVHYGDTVKFTCVPNKGYEMSSVVSFPWEGSGIPSSYQRPSSDVIVFNMPDNDVTDIKAKIQRKGVSICYKYEGFETYSSLSGNIFTQTSVATYDDVVFNKKSAFPGGFTVLIPDGYEVDYFSWTDIFGTENNLQVSTYNSGGISVLLNNMNRGLPNSTSDASPVYKHTWNNVSYNIYSAFIRRTVIPESVKIRIIETQQ